MSRDLALDDSCDLLVASTGGHLQELVALRPRLSPQATRIVWVTHDHPQTRSLLCNETVHILPAIPPRGYRAAALAVPAAFRILGRHPVTRVISTGAGVALPLFTAARAHGIPCHYIESAARAHGPSLTGSLVSHIPGVRIYNQSSNWFERRWKHRGSVFDGYEATTTGQTTVRRVLVTLGTNNSFPFRRAIDRLSVLLPTVLGEPHDIIWQTGDDEGRALPGRVTKMMSHGALSAAMADADVVIAHAGVGSALMALQHGKCPVLLPRSHAFGEHVDDHQDSIAHELHRRGLAVRASPEELSSEHLYLARSVTVRTVASPPHFELGE